MSDLETRIEKHTGMKVTGVQKTYDAQNSTAGIPAQWMHFSGLMAAIPGQVQNSVTYGVTLKADESGNLTYLTGVEVESDHQTDELITVTLSPQTYVVYHSNDNIASIQSTFERIFSSLLAEGGYQHNGAPAFERYTDSFDPVTGEGGWEVWVPIND